MGWGKYAEPRSDEFEMARKSEALGCNITGFSGKAAPTKTLGTALRTPENNPAGYGFAYYFTVDKIEKGKWTNTRTTADFHLRETSVTTAWKSLEDMLWAEGIENVVYEVTAINIRTWALEKLTC